MFRSRRKTSELPKLSLAVVIGYLLKTITMSDNQCSQTCPSCAPATEKCSICITCQPSTPLCPLSDADNEPLKEPSKPKNMYEVLRYDYFNKSQIFNNFDDDPRIWLLRHQSDDIKDMTTQLIQLYNKADSKNWHFSKLVNGYRRYDPLRGEEYLIDAELTTEQINDIGQRETVFNSVRFEAVKPVTKLRLLSSTKYNNKQTIYFILPLTHLNDRFKNFVKNVAAVGWTKPGENVCLLIVLFALQSTEMKTFLEEIKQEFPLADFRIIETQGEFSRGLGLDLASRQLSNSSLLFFCDVDVNVTETFLQRCRQNAVQGQQVYYPMVFAQYTPSLILKYAPPGVHVDEINKYTGYWVFYGYGMACMYNEDYRRVGGFDLNARGWGGEDVYLFTKHVKSDLKVLRAADPALIHVYHDKFCDPALPSDQTRMCLATAAEGLGFKQVLGRLVLATHGFNITSIV